MDEASIVILNFYLTFGGIITGTGLPWGGSRVSSLSTKGKGMKGESEIVLRDIATTRTTRTTLTLTSTLSIYYNTPITKQQTTTPSIIHTDADAQKTTHFSPYIFWSPGIPLILFWFKDRVSLDITPYRVKLPPVFLFHWIFLKQRLFESLYSENFPKSLSKSYHSFSTDPRSSIFSHSPPPQVYAPPPILSPCLRINQ